MLLSDKLVKLWIEYFFTVQQFIYYLLVTLKQNHILQLRLSKKNPAEVIISPCSIICICTG